jgi:ketosteroid isomerase-like protein
VIWVAVVVLVIALAIALVVAVARDPGPAPAEVAMAFEHAWDLLDFDVVYRISGPELHDGMRKAQFVAAKKAAYAETPRLGRLVGEVAAESERQEGDAAVVVTRLTLRDGTVVHNEVRMVRRSRAWQVVGYDLRPAPAA